MPMDEVEPPYFTVLCTDDELDEHLTVCENSDFRVDRDGKLETVRVRDRGAVLLDAVRAAGGWVVRLDAAYYRHPFAPSDGNAPPGVP